MVSLTNHLSRAGRTNCGERSRTISADTVVQSYANPQTLNRYSYCVNNPLKYTDPSGHDYIFIGGAGQDWTCTWWTDMLIALGWDPAKERAIFIGDPGRDAALEGPRWETYDQYEALVNELATGAYKDIKLIGFSEGACATLMVLDKLANDPSFLEDTDVRSQLTAAFILEAITWPSPLVHGNNPRTFVDLPREIHGKSEMKDVVLADIWNVASVVHQRRPLPGWGAYSHTYDSRGGFGAWCRLLFGPIAWSPDQPFLTPLYYHSDVTTNAFTVDVMKRLLNQ